MKHHGTALRAIAIEFALRIVVPLQWIIAAIVIILTALSIWLVVSIDPWWWLLLAPVIVISVIVTLFFVLLNILFKFIRPAMSVAQKQTVTTLVDSLSDVAETWQTPRVFILGRILFDIVRRREYTYLKSIVSDSTQLKQKYTDVVQSFKP